jgi:hypothetical protein
MTEDYLVFVCIFRFVASTFMKSNSGGS